MSSEGQCLKAGPVFSWHLASYSAELWAILNAVADSQTCLCIHCDCQAVVKHVQFLLDHEKVPATWPHQAWWNFLLCLHQERKLFAWDWLQVCWIPAHVLPDIPIQLITPDMAKAKKFYSTRYLVEKSGRWACKDCC